MLAEPKPSIDAREPEPVEPWAANRVLKRLAFGPDVVKDEYSNIKIPKRSVPMLVSKAVVKPSTNPALAEPATAAAATTPTIEEMKV
jgi:hypothetical protein